MAKKFTDVFNTVQIRKPDVSTFDMSYDHKTSLNMGYLVPCHVQECLPGDYYKMSSEAIFRMMPMIAPIMDRVNITIHHWFCPNRILWPNWEKFITGGIDYTATPPAFPVLETTDANPLVVTAGSLPNYLGMPIGTFNTNDGTISALPFAAYQRIYYDWYMDQNAFQFNDPIVLTDGVQATAQSADLVTMMKRAWEHDYFTSSLPFVQKGDPVGIPFSVDQDLLVKMDFATTNSARLRRNTTNAHPAVNDALLGLNTTGVLTGNTSGHDYKIDPNETLIIDKDDINASMIATVNDLRTATALQKFYEKLARTGSRYKEYLLGNWAVLSSDARLDRPEYIGGSKTTMAISEVLQTSQTDSTAQGTMAGHGIAIADGNMCSYRCEEHGWIISILNIQPKTTYYQGLPKFFRKRDKLDFAIPDFVQLGEQPVTNGELYWNFTAPDTNDDPFGYLPIYSDYRYNSSRVSSQMATTLDFWHMARKFSVPPTWNSDFIEADPTFRIFADNTPTNDQIVAHIYHKIEATRKLPFYGTPGGTL